MPKVNASKAKPGSRISPFNENGRSGTVAERRGGKDIHSSVPTRSSPLAVKQEDTDMRTVDDDGRRVVQFDLGADVGRLVLSYARRFLRCMIASGTLSPFPTKDAREEAAKKCLELGICEYEITQNHGIDRDSLEKHRDDLFYTIMLEAPRFREVATKAAGIYLMEYLDETQEIKDLFARGSHNPQEKYELVRNVMQRLLDSRGLVHEETGEGGSAYFSTKALQTVVLEVYYKAEDPVAEWFNSTFRDEIPCRALILPVVALFHAVDEYVYNGYRQEITFSPNDYHILSRSVGYVLDEMNQSEEYGATLKGMLSDWAELGLQELRLVPTRAWPNDWMTTNDVPEPEPESVADVSEQAAPIAGSSVDPDA